MDYQQLITFIMEMIGTIAFAARTMVAVDRAMDIFGVIVLGVTTAVGGGAVRDVILGIVPPAMFQRPIYTIVATFTSCIVFLILYLKKSFCRDITVKHDKIMLVMDSISLGILL
ncbi:MAG: trimeric intracellular cation channel family protein [Eubacterium ramulus]